jgi:hypothetical protein
MGLLDWLGNIMQLAVAYLQIGILLRSNLEIEFMRAEALGVLSAVAALQKHEVLISLCRILESERFRFTPHLIIYRIQLANAYFQVAQNTLKLRVFCIQDLPLSFLTLHILFPPVSIALYSAIKIFSDKLGATSAIKRLLV